MTESNGNPKPWRIEDIIGYLGEKENRVQYRNGMLTQAFTHEETNREIHANHYILTGYEQENEKTEWHKFIWNNGQEVVSMKTTLEGQPDREELVSTSPHLYSYSEEFDVEIAPQLRLPEELVNHYDRLTEEFEEAVTEI